MRTDFIFAAKLKQVWEREKEGSKIRIKIKKIELFKLYKSISIYNAPPIGFSL